MVKVEGYVREHTDKCLWQGSDGACLCVVGNFYYNCICFIHSPSSLRFDWLCCTECLCSDFWAVFHDLTLEEKKKLLMFATGSDRAPVDGLKSLKLTIVTPFV